MPETRCCFHGTDGGDRVRRGQTGYYVDRDRGSPRGLRSPGGSVGRRGAWW